MVHHPDATKGNHASQQHPRQCLDKDDEQAREGAQHALGAQPKLPEHPIKRPDHGARHDDQQDDFENGPVLPRHLDELRDLMDRPGPDHFHKAKDGLDAGLQKMQNLTDDLLHDRFSPAAANRTECKTPILVRHAGQAV
jgi:hypothetical protein